MTNDQLIQIADSVRTSGYWDRFDVVRYGWLAYTAGAREAKQYQSLNEDTMTVPFRTVLEAPAAQDHSCSYFCNRIECITRQRDELRDRLSKQRPVLWRLKDQPGVITEGRPINPDLWEPLGVLV